MSDLNAVQDSRGRFCRKTLREKFEAKAVKRRGCWLWNGNAHKKGYGCLWHDGRLMRATHASWGIHRGVVPRGLYVLHKCDNPPCTNPKHLFLGTQGDNMTDKALKSRAGKKLTGMAAGSIRREHARGVPATVLAKKYKVSDCTIRLVARRITWRHV